MPQHPKNTHSEQINRAQMAINNTLADSEIQKAVAACGFPAATMKEGLKLYEAALAAINAEARAEGDQKLATAKADAAQKKARATYQMLAKMSRAAFRNEKARLSALGLSGGEPKTIAAFITAGYLLFDNAAGIKEIQDVLAGYGYAPAKLKQERGAIEAFDAANNAQESAMGTAQHTTQSQALALKGVNGWVNHYLQVAKVALHDQPQLLEKLGIGVRSSKTKAQRGAPAKAKATRLAKKLKP